MNIENSFTVPLPVPDAWRMLLDIEGIMPCVPGAELLEVLEDRTYKGKVSVKLGPVALGFTGTAKIEDIDEAGRQARIIAKGSDAKGRGGANAVVQFQLSPAGTGTLVAVKTTLNLTGAVAQYGRGTGIIQGVATQLTRQFAECLQARLAHEHSGAQPANPESGSTPPSRTAKPIGLAVLLRVLWGAITGLFTGTKHER